MSWLLGRLRPLPRLVARSPKAIGRIETSWLTRQVPPSVQVWSRGQKVMSVGNVA